MENQNTNPEASQYPDPTKPVFKPHRRFPLPSISWIIFIAANIIIPVTFAAIYLNLTQNSQPKDEKTNTPTVAPTQLPASNAADASPTADWLTYEYEGLYSVKYPSDWTPLRTESLVRFFRPGVKVDSTGLGPDDPDAPYISIFNVSSEYDPESCRGDCRTIENAKDVKIGNLTARQLEGIEGSIGGGCGCNYKELIFKKATDYYVLTLFGAAEQTSEDTNISAEDEQTFQQIASTFKFTY